MPIFADFEHHADFEEDETGTFTSHDREYVKNLCVRRVKSRANDTKTTGVAAFHGSIKSQSADNN
jgi:hypothetical protein